MKKIVLILLYIFFTTNYSLAQNLKNISQNDLIKIEKKYGLDAKKRIVLWDNMIESIKNEKIVKKLKKVNDFFNNFRYVSDKTLWKRTDYWASPYEFIGKGAGDCEDYAIAKYFALRAAGVSDKKLKITYVKIKQSNKKYEEAHMVLNYYHKPNSTPIVLDNVIKKLKLASKRDDLKPVYSFNASTLWKAQNKTKNLKKGDNNLTKWKAMMSRI